MKKTYAMQLAEKQYFNEHGKFPKGKQELTNWFTKRARYYWENFLNFKKYEKNWDGYGAEPLSNIVYDRAELVIESFNFISPQIFLTGYRTIQLKFSNYKDEDIEIEIYSDHYEATIFYKDGCIRGKRLVELQKLEEYTTDFLQLAKMKRRYKFRKLFKR